MSKKSARLEEIYERLLATYGPQHWWPAQTPFEVIVGAILTQSAAWVNVEKAINSLKAANALSPSALRRLTQAELGSLIHSCGYHNVKALKLKKFAEWLGERYGDSLEQLFSLETGAIRSRLLALYGIGPETADSILLYAGSKPVFVIDAYTRRIVRRLGFAPGRDTYDAYQKLFMDNLPYEARLFNEYHALLVHLGKKICRPAPRCPECCLRDICATGASLETPAAGHYN